MVPSEVSDFLGDIAMRVGDDHVGGQSVREVPTWREPQAGLAGQRERAVARLGDFAGQR
jgi:hypothetical protein